jgi:O-acetyl-ADP-ribose deacetylase (regulator of RNase III)
MAQAKMREKKLAEAKRAALNTNKRKTAPTAIPAVSAGMGQ